MGKLAVFHSSFAVFPTVAMEGLVEEGSEIMEDDFEGEVLDVGLIAAAQRVEHYEIAAYGTLCAFADLLGQSQHALLLRQTLDEEKATDETQAALPSNTTIKTITLYIAAPHVGWLEGQLRFAVAIKRAFF